MAARGVHAENIVIERVPFRAEVGFIIARDRRFVDAAGADHRSHGHRIFAVAVIGVNRDDILLAVDVNRIGIEVGAFQIFLKNIAVGGDGGGMTVGVDGGFCFPDGDLIDVLPAVGKDGGDACFSDGDTVDSAAAVYRDHRFVVAFPRNDARNILLGKHDQTCLFLADRQL